MKRSVFRRNAPEANKTAVEAPRAEEATKGTSAQRPAVEETIEEKMSPESSDANKAGAENETNGSAQQVTATDEQPVVRDASEGTAAAASEGEASARQALEAEVKENYDKYLRAIAELENFKKRALRERAELLRYSGESLARDLLEIADNFHLAFAQDLSGTNEEFVKGFRMILEQFNSILQKHEIKAESSMGTIFDPNKQQALASVPTAEHPAGTVLEEFKKAYFLKDKLLRPAQVVVAAEIPAELPAEAAHEKGAEQPKPE